MNAFIASLTLLFVTAAAGGAAAQVLTLEVQPETYDSPNGAFRLRVVPGERHGGGPADYCLTTADGTVVWSGKKDFTLLRAQVTDRGCVAGYGYWKGPQGFGTIGRRQPTKREIQQALEAAKDLMSRLDAKADAESPPAESRPTESRPIDELLRSAVEDDRAFIVYLTETGVTQLCHAIPRTGVSTCMGGPSVHVIDVSLEPANDHLTALVSIENESGGHATHLFVFQASTGAVLSRTVLDKVLLPQGRIFRVFAARAIRGTPLTLVSFAGYLGSQWRNGCFGVLDISGALVWSLDIPGDYEVGDETKEDQLWEEIVAGGALLPSANATEFTIRSVKKDKTISFGAARGLDGRWTVSELRSSPYVTPSADVASRPVKATPPWTRVAAKPRGEIRLEAAATAASEIRDCFELMAAPDGSLVFRRNDRDGGGRRFVVVNPLTRETRSFAAGIGLSGFSSYSPYSAERWLVAGTAGDATAGSGSLDIFWLDTTTGQCEKAVEAKITRAEGIASLGGRNFVVLAATHGKYTISTHLTAYSGSQRSWIVGSGFGDAAGLFSPESMCVTSRGEIAVLENIVNRVQFFDATGAHARTIDLATSWKRKPNYPSRIAPDVDGGVIVYDFDGTPPIVRMRHDGTVLASLTPAFEDGRLIKAAVVVTPSGQLWTTDGQCLCRLDDRGVVKEVLGAGPSPASLGSVASIALGPNREIHALSSRTGAVHVFDEAGRILRVCEPDPKDFSEKVSFLTHLTVAPTGDVYVERATMSLTSAGEYVHFDHKGKRVGIDDFSLGDVTSTVYFQPTSGRRWVVGYQTIVLTDGAGKALRTIDRSADGRWFGTILRSAQSPDGSLAFLAPRRGRWSRWTRGGEVSDSKQLHVLDRDGGLVKTVSLPENMISYVGFAFDGTRAAFLVATGERSFDLVVVTVADGSGIAFPLGSSSDGFQAAHLPPGLDEVWISSGDSVLRRFAIGK